ncbi:putative polyketide synthase [Metarhizium brunneum]
MRVETPACDITDLERTRETFGKLMPEMPPIKGALQMSIVVWDCLFNDLEYDDWSIAVLPNGLDIFILLSSASGLAGIKSQTN